MIDVQEIKTVGRQCGIDDIRITTTTPFTTAHTRHDEQKDEGLFTNRRHRHLENIDTFYSVESKLHGARSIIAGCLCYLTDEPVDAARQGLPMGRIARYTWRNHYAELRKRLEQLAQYLHKKYGARYCVYSNGPVAEKPIAERSGIGYYGKHSIIVHQFYGSWIVLGEIITDIEIVPDEPLNLDCGACTACMDACPTQALIRPYVLDRRRCIQELTNWLGVIPDDIASVWDNRLYGCTTCQEICPINRNVKPLKPRTDIGAVGSSLPLFDILQIEENEYRQRFNSNQISASWIYFKAIQRNALIALGNLRDTAALPVLEHYAQSRDELISKTAMWALTKF